MSGIGRRLVEAREARGLTLDDAERDTRISKRYLQALEQEQFDVIPAPVYARGFLRSYSQYVGLDPQEMLAMFPREDGMPGAPAQRPAKATHDAPLSAQGAARPTWKRPGPPAPPPGTGREGRGPGRQAQEPTIGIDIGVPARQPSPARRLNTDPAAQTRSVLVAVVALVAIGLIVLIALFISRLGGDDNPAGTGPVGGPTDAAETADNQDDEPTPGDGAANGNGQTSGIDVTPGVVPDLVGQPVEVARLAIQEAGFEVDEIGEKSEAFDPGIVTNQAPAAGLALEPGATIIISVSEGP